MDDQVLVRVLHRFTHRAEQRQPLGNREAMLVAIDVDGQAVHVLHDEIRPLWCALFHLGNAAVEESGDSGVLKVCENLPLASKALKGLGAVRLRADQLHGNALLEVAVVALGAVNGPHATTADVFQQAVRADPPADHAFGGLGRLQFVQHRLDQVGQGRFEKTIGGRRSPKQFLDFLTKRLIHVASPLEIGHAGRSRQVQRAVEHGVDAIPVVQLDVFHGCVLRIGERTLERIETRKADLGRQTTRPCSSTILYRFFCVTPHAHPAS